MKKNKLAIIGLEYSLLGGDFRGRIVTERFAGIGQ